MSRQDANAAFARTSFLYGGNADYIDELYAASRRGLPVDLLVRGTR